MREGDLHTKIFVSFTQGEVSTRSTLVRLQRLFNCPRYLFSRRIAECDNAADCPLQTVQF